MEVTNDSLEERNLCQNFKVLKINKYHINFKILELKENINSKIINIYIYIYIYYFYNLSI